MKAFCICLLIALWITPVTAGAAMHLSVGETVYATQSLASSKCFQRDTPPAADRKLQIGEPLRVVSKAPYQIESGVPSIMQWFLRTRSGVLVCVRGDDLESQITTSANTVRKGDYRKLYSEETEENCDGSGLDPDKVIHVGEKVRVLGTAPGDDVVIQTKDGRRACVARIYVLRGIRY